MKYKSKTEIEYHYNKQKEILKQIHHKNDSNIKLMIFNVDFDLINLIENNFINNLMQDKLLSNSRINITMNSFVLPKKEKMLLKSNFLSNQSF